VHSAIVSGLNYDSRTVTVEWFEKGETKGKEVCFSDILLWHNSQFYLLFCLVQINFNFEVHFRIIIANRKLSGCKETTTTTTLLQPFYGPLNCVRDYPGELVPEK